ncbi:peptidyl-tRNA hydrolase ICT1, mitochondrial [Strongylocentrotus purpuratus]|uniref:Large ribosomal subunit protein mL62 n=1 Tax=Strongylocentrotus purpuratus TaxID=7668 RepID=A0A7M7NTK5_STRPU|nr:peptidyl-tRNA hydrolase ICT1, mitochondrial [Strongylocentrotus purpuratus]
MIRRASCILWRQRNFCTTQNRLNVGQFQSNYSLNKLYPHSEQDITISCRKSHETADQNIESKFSGQIPVDKLLVKYSRSGGAGGQNVQKVETKVDVRFLVATAEWLPQNVREKLQIQQKNKINSRGEMVIVSERTRSQIRNFSDCLQKIRDMVAEAERKPKEPSEKDKAVRRIRVESANRERLRGKKAHSATKHERQVSFDD